MRLLPGCCTVKDERSLDVLVDIDATLVYPGRGLLVGATLLHLGGGVTYSLAHGALEFLAALDALGSIRLGLYSCGPYRRNRSLAKALIQEMHKHSYPFKQKLEAFSVPHGMYGKKVLKGLRRGLHLERAIVVDDGGRNVQPGEESNLLKIYEIGHHYHDLTAVHKLYRARLYNNLVRALGMILKSIELSEASGVGLVRALHSLQWDSDNMYLHESSNTEDIYKRGLSAMRALNPDFSLAYAITSPWSLCQQDDTVFPRRHNLIIRECTDAL